MVASNVPLTVLYATQEAAERRRVLEPA
jgi:hypothetical protein